MDTFDYVIIGAGSAGCVLANKLSEDPSITVCVLEAGGRDWHPFIHIPAGFIKTFYNRSVNWGYSMEPSEWTGGRRIYAPRGKTLGGSSSINGHIFNRGQRLDYETWSQFGNRGWGYADVLPYFRELESREGAADSTYRGKNGPVTVSDIDWKHPLCEAFIAGAETLGIPRNPDYNGAIQEGISYAQRTINHGRRVSAATAFLHPAMKRTNLNVRTHAHAVALLFDGKRATGVRYQRGGRGGPGIDIAARREVILSGGTFNSPQLLQVSGIGAPNLLAQHGIPVRHALEGVGENLKDHYAPRFVARVKNSDTINQLAHGLPLARQIAKYVTTRQGILALSPTLIYCFWHSEPGLATSDLQLTFTPASYKEGVQGQLETEPGMSVAAWQQRPDSKGFVHVQSADPCVPPMIQPNYLAEASDRRILLAGMKLARRLMKTKPLEPYYDYEDFPGPNVQSDDELLASARERGTTTFHPSGTCRMGPASDRQSVVDDQLRVRGLFNIRVVDASIMPTMLSANLNAATLMIGAKAADMILGRAPKEPVVL